MRLKGAIGRAKSFKGVLLATTVAAVIPAGPMKTLISVGTSTNTAPSNTLTKYTPLCGGPTINAMWNSSTSMPKVPCTVAGTFSVLWVRMPNALTGTQSHTWALVVNGTDSGLTLTIDANTPAHPLGGQYKAVTVPIHVNKNDTVCLKSAPTNTPTQQSVVQFGLLFTADAGQSSPLFAVWAGNATQVGWGMFSTNNSSGQLELSCRCLQPTDGAYKTLSIGTNVAPGGTETRSVTLVVDGIDKATVTLTGAQTFNTIAINVPVTQNQLVQLRKDQSVAAAVGITLFGAEWCPTTAGENLLFMPGRGNLDGVTTVYQCLNGSTESTEVTPTNVYAPFAVPVTLTKLRAYLGGAPGTGKSRTLTVRKSGQDTTTAIVLTGAATVGSWQGSLAFAANDTGSWKEVPTGTPAASNPVSLSGVLVVN